VSSTEDWRLAIPERDRRLLRRWIWLIVAVTTAIVAVGGITRLTQSGLSIVRWEPIVGVVPPLGETQWLERFEQYRQYPEYQQLRPSMTLAEFKQIFLWEYLHRLLARGLGLVFAVPFAVFWLTRRLSPPMARRALALFGLGLAQGVMGWLMVASGLIDRPSVSHLRLAAHLSLAFVIVGAAVWLARDLAVSPTRVLLPARSVSIMTRGLGVVSVLLAAQVVWGAFVAGLDAGLGYNTFPLMAGYLVPPGVFSMHPAIAGLLHHPAGVQWMHRVLGTVLLAAAVWLAWRTQGTTADTRSRRFAWGLAGGIAAQYLLGVLTLLLVVPVSIAVAHQVMALVLVAWCVGWFHHLRNAQVH
jgi:heme a synthase